MAEAHHLKSIAFPCISTGVYGYPHAAAAKIAWDTIKKHIQNGAYKGEVVLCCFREEDAEIYNKLMQEDEIMKSFKPQPWLLPQPVLIIGTYDEQGRPNAMNAAWGGQWDMKES